MSVEVGIEAFLDLGDKVDNIHRTVTKRAGKPLIKRVAGSAIIAPAATTGIVELSERPSMGRIWNILKVGVYNVDLHTSLAGVIVDLYANTLIDPVNPPPLVNGITTVGVPSSTYFSRQVEWCKQGESIFGVISAATAGQQIVLMSVIADYAIEDIEGVVV